ncbi:MAG: hypothetical protein RJA07_1129 [Bacteroidota bacterium]|jgi:hypothetical protein
MINDTKNIKRVTFLLVVMAALVSCSKKPTAVFSIPNTIAITGEKVKFTNDSKDAATYSWQFDDNTDLVDSVSPIHRFNQSGNYTISLKAYSKNHKYISEHTEALKVYGNCFYNYNGEVYNKNQFNYATMAKTSDTSGIYYSSSNIVNSATGNYGQIQIQIWKQIYGNTQSSLSEADFNSLFSLGRLNLAGTNFHLLITNDNNPPCDFSITSTDVFTITNLIAYKNGYIVEATFAYNPVGAYRVDNGYVCFYVGR